METPAEIEFVGIAPLPAVRDDIDRHIAKLEQRFGRITACRVAVRGPGDGHANSNRFEVTIRLALPDRKDVNVARQSADQRANDVHSAVTDAFRRAQRQLQDQVRRMKQMVRQHEPSSPVGTVARIDPSGDFGFIATGDGREVYFHRNSVLNDGFGKLQPGAAVAFAEEDGDKGPQASTVRPTSKRPVMQSG
jgi:cold shock CspA family protein